MTGLAQVRQLRMLAGKSDPRIDGMHAAATRLLSLIEAWQTFPPRASTLQDAENTLEGLRRTLIELREARGAAVREVPPNAA